ncbi:ketoacyl-ACP synthase III [Chryseobacterium wangxinyae]|uniref:ketoacyl-ACP synthase III n=1 Tax=Chryseobacterium sp. CY350 TaxID=2997336 RepID=UPI00226E55EB|nr:ketoacyl-ACP synthase III [Chryseobacterium sp. CY350]MCY0979384.1 ketoacyl-ACP synthase III [Chryseobacterium sp. CY350]WBZ97120.1 ketoacyl-ACP synthase III [Chryseobacterium sp. CY350]
MGAIIKHIEYIFPEKGYTNDDLSKQFPDYDFTKFDTKVGIKKRYWVNESETALDLAEKACFKLFHNFDKDIVDFIIYCTQSPEYILPTTACILQQRLGLNTSVGAFDFNLGCSGYIYGLSMAKGLIETKQAKNVLLVTAETYSKYLNPEDKSNRGIFGDAATATIISYDEENNNIQNFLFGTDGLGYDKLIIKNGASKNKIETNSKVKEYGSGNRYTDNELYMDGPEIFNFTSAVIPKFTLNLLEKNNVEMDECNLFVLHQANQFMLDFLRKKIKAPKEKFYIDLEDGGNTVSCTIPIALKRWSDGYSGEFPVENIALVGFGVGLSWGGTVISVDKKF